jgi:hypothetical protein
MLPSSLSGGWFRSPHSCFYPLSRERACQGVRKPCLILQVSLRTQSHRVERSTSMVAWQKEADARCNGDAAVRSPTQPAFSSGEDVQPV